MPRPRCHSDSTAIGRLLGSGPNGSMLAVRWQLGYNCTCMIRALLLIIDPSRSWEAIKNNQHTVTRVSLSFLLPLLVLTSLGESLGLTRLGVDRGNVT